MSPRAPRRYVASLRQGAHVIRRDGWLGLTQRVIRKLYQRLDVETLDFPLLTEDIVDSRTLQLFHPEVAPSRARPLTIGWVTTPPALGSGGHTTMFRMISGLEAAGHTCVLYLYDRYAGDIRGQEAVIRQGWPDVKAQVRSSRTGIADLDACVATSWQTAHVMARRGAQPMQRFYFIQDFEPFFYARGSEYALAEDTYRFGFHCISTGHMVADTLKSIGIGSEVVEFGCDVDVYHLLDPERVRSGVVFYARPGVPRRGFLLGCLALAEFHRRHPDQPIHVYGSADQDFDFPVMRHRQLKPKDLNALYNECIAGLAMSFTNISLVAEEMLAAGLVPVINDSSYSRADLDNEHAVFAAPTPSALADALTAAVLSEDVLENARRAAGSVRADNWKPAQDLVRRSIEAHTYG